MNGLLIGLALCATALLAATSDEVGDLNDRARVALDRDRPQEAITLLEQARQLDPREPVLARNLAYAYFKRGQQMLTRRQLSSATADFTRALQLDPDEQGFRLHLAQLHLRRYHLNSAEHVLRDAITHFGDEAAEAWLMLGDVLNLDDDLVAAQEAYGRALALGEMAAADDAETSPVRAKRSADLLEQTRQAAERNARQYAVEKDYITDTTPSFILRYPAGTSGPSFGVRLVSALERARAEVCQTLDIFPRQRITVVLYPPEEFKQATGTHDWVGGLFDRKIRLPIVDVVADADKIEAAFRHEFTHLIVSEVDPACPSVINEGLAQVLEVGRGRGMTRLVDWLDARKGGRDAVPEIAELPASFMTLRDVDQVRLAYLVSYAFVDHVVAHHGMAAALRWIREASTRTLPEAYRAAVGRSLDHEQTLFRDLLRRAP